MEFGEVKSMSDEVKSLSDSRLRLWVTELAGWTDLQMTSRGINGTTSDGHRCVEIPDYPKDLNAMHELETRFLHKNGLLDKYYSNLEDLLTWNVLDARSASARIRAEAFVLTVG